MSKSIVRIHIEDKNTKELIWYACCEAESDKVQLAYDPPVLHVEIAEVDDVLTTFTTSVSLMDLAAEMYKTYAGADADDAIPFNKLPGDIRARWLKVAERAMQLGALYSTPQNNTQALINNALHNAWDTSDIDLGSGEG